MRLGQRSVKNPELNARVCRNIRGKVNSEEINITMLSEWSGLPYSTVSRYIRGNVTGLTLHYVAAIAAVLNVTIEWLMEEHDEYQ